MSTRTLIIAALLCSALVSPWLFSDWFAENAKAGTGDRHVQERPFMPVAVNPEVSVPPMDVQQRQVRKMTQAIQQPFQTDLKVTNRVAKRPQIKWSRKAATAKNAHHARIKKELANKGLQFGAPVFCRLFKEEREFELWVKPNSQAEFSLFKIYRIANFAGSLGPKRKAGDNQTPEGFYHVDPTRMMSDLGVDLGYPNLFDRHWKRDGSQAYISNGSKTRNSFTVSEHDMEEIFLIMANAMDGGQKTVRVHSFPFRMVDRGLDKRMQSNPRNDFFWANLKEGYDFFEIVRRPPSVTVSSKGKYQFSLPN